MYKSVIKNIAVCCSIVTLSACSRIIDKNLSPPVETKWVSIEVRNPSKYTKPFPLEVVYISRQCIKKRVSGFDGSIITEPSYNGINIPLQQQGDTDIWIGKVAINGGGPCNWSLSELNLGIEYTDTTHLEQNLVLGSAVGATIAFDNYAAKNGQFRIVDGDLKINPKYFPYITEWNLNKSLKELSLLGRESFLSYWVVKPNKIIFEPVLDESKVVRYVQIKKKVEGTYSKIIYPDGSVTSDGTVFPDFDKVDSMVIK